MKTLRRRRRILGGWTSDKEAENEDLDNILDNFRADLSMVVVAAQAYGLPDNDPWVSEQVVEAQTHAKNAILAREKEQRRKVLEELERKSRNR